MANKFPLILNTSANQIQEIASGDNLDLTGSGIHNAGVITATSFSGSGANLTGIDATSIKDSGGNVKIQAQASGAIHTGIATFNGASTFAGNINANGNIVGDNSTNITGIAGVTATTLTGTLQTAAQTNITSVGTLSTLNVSGNVSIGGTLTYEDVTNIDSVGLITARNGITVSAGTATFQGAIDANGDLDVDGHTNLDNVSIAGVTTFQNDLNLGDNDILRIGNSSDLQIYHDGNSHVSDRGGTGALWIESNDQVVIKQNDANHYMAIFNRDGASELRYNNSTKISTTNTGSIITGICTATDFSGAAGGAADFPNGLTGTTATLSGSASVSGDLDIAADIRHIGDENTRISFSGSDTIQLRTGGSARVQIEDGNTTINNNVFLPDNVQLKIGNSVGTPDLKIYHDGNNRVHASNGYIQYRASAHYINDEGNTINFIRCENSCVKLHYGSGLKLETKSDGIELTGHITATGALTIKTSDADFIVQDPTDSTTNFIWRDNSESKLFLGVAGSAVVTARSDVNPHQNNTFNLGTTSHRWANAYVNDMHFSNEGSSNSVDGTWGDWTLQEGDENIFMLNNRTGKKYKMNLTEVS